MTNYNRGAIFISGSGKGTGLGSAGRYTGSFSKIFALPASGSTAGKGNQMCVIDRIEFGRFAPHGGTHTVYNAIDKSIFIHEGTTIDGPILSLKIASGSFLAYKNE